MHGRADQNAARSDGAVSALPMGRVGTTRETLELHTKGARPRNPLRGAGAALIWAAEKKLQGADPLTCGGHDGPVCPARALGGPPASPSPPEPQLLQVSSR